MSRPGALADDARQPEYGAVYASGETSGGRTDEIGAGSIHQAGRSRVSFTLGDHGDHHGHHGYRDAHQEAFDGQVPAGFGLAAPHPHPSSSSTAALHPHSSLFSNNHSTLHSPPSTYHSTNPALESPNYSSSAFAGNRSSHHSYNSTTPILQNRSEFSHADPPQGHKSEFYDFLGGYIDLYQPEDHDALAHEAEMASYNNQYGPSASHNSSRQPAQQNYQQGQQNYQQPTNHDQYDQYGYDSNDQYANYNSPYRDQRSDSPDMHPGMGQPSRNQNYENTPSRSPYGQQNDHNYAPYAAADAGAVTSMNMNRADEYTPSHSNPARYNALATSSSPERPTGDYQDRGQSSPYSPYHNHTQTQSSSHASYNSADHLAASAAPPASSTPRGAAFNNGGYSNGNGYGGYGYDPQAQYSDPYQHQHPYQNPYDNHSISRNNLNGMDYIDPTSIADDGDVGLEYHQPKRRSMISLNRHSIGMRSNPAIGAAAVGGAAGVAGAAAVHGASGTGEASRGMYGGDMARSVEPEKPADFNRFSSIQVEEGKSRKRKKIWLIILAILLVCGIAGGVVGALLAKKKADEVSSGASSSGASGSDAGDLDKNSPSVKKLMNNKNLHKVFMGMAYTPINSQYPDCLTNKPIQNNVTLDLAVLSQLTNVLRLYGTDCGQTEMVLTAIDKLGLKDMKIWAGVWLDKNQTTTDRQISQFWDIVDKFGTKYIKGVAVGNEVLYRKDLSITQLKTYISDIRTNLTSKNMNMPVASSDLGDNWTADLASSVDAVMSNVHPFFGGLTVDKAAGWTWDFWQSHDVVLTKGTNKQNIISEVGWPSQGGNACGTSAPCPDSTSGSVAGISQLNTFMNSWVCQALANGTDYFWFELLDEPWKYRFNTDSQQWEDHWGLMDVNRNLKPGVKIPDCGGKTIPAQT